MEPVTHILTGAALARTGLNRRAAYATLAMAVSAELPDVDTLWGLRGPVEGFQHHRGITHTFVGIPLEAGLVLAGCYVVHRVRLRRVPLVATLTKAPVAWVELYFFSLLALLSHILLDYTNNYGIRPFFPFNPRWYAGSFVFIFDPLLFALLLLPIVMPPLFGLISSEVGTRRNPFRGRGWAIAALTMVGALWSVRYVEHARAIETATAQSIVPPSSESLPDAPLQPQRILANPDPFNPFRWHVVADYGAFYQLATVNARSATYVPAQVTYLKPTQSAALIAAEASPLGRAYVDWSSMPLVTVSAPGDAARIATPEDTARTAVDTLVTFRDPRFMGDIPFMSGKNAPLTAVVELNSTLHVVRQTMDGRSER